MKMKFTYIFLTALILNPAVANSSPPNADWCDHTIDFRYGVAPENRVANEDRADFFAMLLRMSNYSTIERVKSHLSRTQWASAEIFDLEKDGACTAFLKSFR